MNRESRRQKPSYSDAQASAWLAWLAYSMHRHRYTVFQIEGLQPSWLRTSTQLYVYILLSRLVVGLVIGFIIGLSVGYFVGIITGLMSGLTIGVVDLVRSGGIGGENPDRLHTSLRRIAVRFMGVSLSVWFIGWLIGWQVGNLFMGLTMGWMFGAVFGVTYGLRIHNFRISNEIRTVETLRWSWWRAIKYGTFGILIGLIVGFVAESSYRIFLDVPFSEFPNWWLEAPLLVALVGALCGVIFGGLDSGVIPIKMAPNQGIRLSFRNSIFAGAIAGSLIGFVGFVSANSLGGLLVTLTGLYRLQGGIIFALTGGLLVALWYGGLDIIQHYTLRLVLSLKGYTPFRFARFLDYAAEELNFLQKVGGGYMFIHRYLLEYFARLEFNDEPENKRQQSQLQ